MLRDIGTYALMSPHTDRFWVNDAPVEGYREGWEQRMIDSAPATKRELAGYLSALFQLRNAAEPPAYCRSLPVYRLQLRVERIIRTIITNRDTKRPTPQPDHTEVVQVTRTRG